jgi:hypothetical protein
LFAGLINLAAVAWQVSKRRCTWLYVMDSEGMMMSISGWGNGRHCITPWVGGEWFLLSVS